MFAIPGIFCTIFFIFLRPQEVYPILQGVPFLNLFFMLTLAGAAVDLRLRINIASPIPTLPWAILFYIWCLFSVAVMKSDQVMPSAIFLFIIVVIYILIAQSIQTFRILERVILLVIVLCGVLTYIAIHQSLAAHQCVVAPEGATNHTGAGTPDGRPCVKAIQCYTEDAQPGADYICEKVGLFGTHSQGDRVRYRGILQDPNEMAAALSAGFAFLLAMWLRTRKRLWGVVAFVGFICVAWGVKETGSRSGQLGFLGVLGVFLLWRFGKKILLVGIPIVVPLLLFVASGGGGGRADADESSALRYDAWRAGLDMFRESPVWGVGFGQFVDRHFLTAHNTYVLILGELGMVGMFIFSMIIWLSIKTPLTAIKRYAGHPEARVAEIWSVALLAAIAAILCGGLFLSFSYHYLLWIFLAFSGGLFASIKRHDPDFEVPVTLWDAAGVTIVNIVIYMLLQLFLKFKGH